MFNSEKYHFREAAATATALVGLGMSGFQAWQGYRQQKQAANDIANYKRQDLDASNPYKNMQISTVGSDMANEQNQITSANAIDAMRNGGSRGIGMLAGVVAQNNTANQNTRAYLDGQINKRDYAIAGDQTEIRGMKEARENADLAGLGQQLQTGKQDMWSGIRGAASSAMYAANNIDWNGDGETQSEKDMASMGNNANSGMSAQAYSRFAPNWQQALGGNLKTYQPIISDFKS